MLKDIKIIDESGIEIKPDKDRLVVIPVKGKNEFIDVEAAKDLVRIIQGQINMIEAGIIERKTGNIKHKTDINSKTGSTT